MISRPFNILYLSSFGNLWGGGQISLFHLVKNLDKSQFRPHVILPEEGILADRLREQSIEVSILELPKLVNIEIHKNLKALYELSRLIKRYDINLIHTDGPRNTFYAGLAAKTKKLPLVWHVRASNPDKYDRLLVYLSSRLILVANSLRSRFHWMSRRHKLVTIYNGIDLSEFQIGQESYRFRKEYGIHEQSLLIGVVGRIEFLKGQKYLIEACGMLKGKSPDFYLLVAGEVVDSTYFKECKDMAKEYGIHNRVFFPGHISNISQFLKEIDIFVLPSLFEAFPRSLIEAMGASKPVVVTDVGGCSEAVEDNISGFIVPPKDAKFLSERIHLLNLDNELRGEMGNAARIRAEKMFTIEHNVKQTEQVYRELLKRNY